MKTWYLTYLTVLLPVLCSAQTPSLSIKTSCMDLTPVQAEELRFLKEEINRNAADIHNAFNKMKDYYQKNNLPYDCVFTIACKGCDGTDYLRYPIKNIKRGMLSNEFLATKGGQYGRSDLEKLFSNKLINLNSTLTFDLSKLDGLQQGKKYDMYIEHALKDSIYAERLAVDDSLHVKFNEVTLVNMGGVNNTTPSENKIYYLHNDRKRYISPRSFTIYSLSIEEKTRLKDAVKDYRKMYPDKNDKQVIDAMVAMLEAAYGAVLSNDMEVWYYSNFKD